MGRQFDALAQLGHHRVAGHRDAQRVFQLLPCRLEPLRAAQVAQAVVAQAHQRGGADRLDPFERIGNGRCRIAHLGRFGQPGAGGSEIGAAGSGFGTADQRAFSGGQALPGTRLVRLQRQRLTEVGNGAVAVFTDAVGAQVLLAGAVVGHHPLGQLHA
jgi:hypothetical protein